MKQHPHKDIINHWLDGGNVDRWGTSIGDWIPNYGENSRKTGVMPVFSVNAKFRITPEPEKITYSVALFGDTDRGRWLDHGESSWEGYDEWKADVSNCNDGFICWVHLDAVFELPEEI